MLKQPIHGIGRKLPELSPASRKSTGAHYTPARFAEFVAEAIIGQFEATDRAATVVDPAMGDGELLAAFLQKWP